MFVRTNLGLNSEHLFHDVDFVIYCEGSPVDGEGASLDELFWHRILSEHGVKVFSKSLGSKTILRPLAERIIAEDLQNVLVAMDRDYDGLRGNVIEDRRVFYTFGYSWESDVFSDFRIEHVLSLFATVTRKRKIIDDFKDFIQRQSCLLKRLTLIDFKYIAHQTALFDRQKPMSIISVYANSEPNIKTDLILNSAKGIRNFQTGQIPRDVCEHLDGALAFYGKALGRLVFQWFVYRTRRIDGCRKTYFETFAAMAIDSLDLLNIASLRNGYYSGQVARI